MPRNQKDPKAETKPKSSTKELMKATEESKRLTEEATRKAIEAIMANKTVDTSEGSSALGCSSVFYYTQLVIVPAKPAFYNELFQKDPPSVIKPKAVFLQTPIQFQSEQQGTTGLTAPAKRLTLMEGSTAKKSRTEQEEISSGGEYYDNQNYIDLLTQLKNFSLFN